ncbi:hypothetical protein DKX38_003842 [Salix brachista]|uniref:GED domain-containing protein n=1 Tax=Salix brachista TaxID=2182728 RepID=A0A5N5N9V4_9ROSI|nr:hypothetical protein DKX38_003842 [Salix brachista]
MEEEIVRELFGRHDGAIEGMLEESPAVAAKREKLNVSIKLLSESKNVLANIMDRITTNIYFLLLVSNIDVRAAL